MQLLTLVLHLSLLDLFSNLICGGQVDAAHLSRDKRQAPQGAGSSTSYSGVKQQKASKQWEQECLAAHNKWRRLHNASELAFDKKISQFSQKRADHIARSDGSEFKHPDDLVYGENLAWHSRPTTSCADLIKMWYDEVDLYDFKAAAFSHETGHFTQLVWKDTRLVGCAKALSSGPKGGVYLVCNYDPPGNFLGEASTNVERRYVKVPTPATTSTSTTTTTTTAKPPTSKVPGNKKKKNKKSTTKAPSSTRTSTTKTGVEYPIQTSTTTTTTTLAPTTTTKPTTTTTKKPASNNKKKNKKKKRKGGKKKRKTTTTTSSPQQ